MLQRRTRPIEAQASRAAQPLDWQPIATAPKESGGPLIDIWCSSPDGIEQWREVDCWWTPNGWANQRGLWNCASHWRVKPDPPAAVPQAAQE